MGQRSSLCFSLINIGVLYSKQHNADTQANRFKDYIAGGDINALLEGVYMEIFYLDRVNSENLVEDIWCLQKRSLFHILFCACAGRNK